MIKARLTSEAINKLRHPKNLPVRYGLIGVTGKLGITTIRIAIRLNDWNSDLTKEAALRHLSDSLDMTRDQLLEIQDE